MQNQLEFAVATRDIPGARELAARFNGTLYFDARDDASKLPFSALTTVVTDDLAPLQEAADVGLYVVCRRVIKPGTAAVYGLFPLIHHPDKSHAESDAHWRDVHAPLALEHHAYMSHYVQLSVVHRIDGAELDGFALCGFQSLDDLKERFFTTEASVAVIRDDITNFADTARSPRW